MQPRGNIYEKNEHGAARAECCFFQSKQPDAPSWSHGAAALSPPVKSYYPLMQHATCNMHAHSSLTINERCAVIKNQDHFRAPLPPTFCRFPKSKSSSNRRIVESSSSSWLCCHCFAVAVVVVDFVVLLLSLLLSLLLLLSLSRTHIHPSITAWRCDQRVSTVHTMRGCVHAVLIFLLKPVSRWDCIDEVCC